MKMCATDKKFLGISIFRWGQIFVGGSIAFAAWTVSYANTVNIGKNNSAAIANHIVRMNDQDKSIRDLEHQMVAMRTDIRWIRENLEDGRIYKRSSRPRD